MPLCRFNYAWQTGMPPGEVLALLRTIGHPEYLRFADDSSPGNSRGAAGIAISQAAFKITVGKAAPTIEKAAGSGQKFFNTEAHPASRSKFSISGPGRRVTVSYPFLPAR